MKVINRRAGFNYRFLEKYEAGVVLNGAEVKAIRKGNIDLGQSFVKIIEGEAFLINAIIPVEGGGDYRQDRVRKVLLHKKQIISIQSKIKAKRLTLVPVSVYTKRHLVKVEIALAKSKKKYQKKELIKRRDIERDAERELREDKRKHEARIFKP